MFYLLKQSKLAKRLGKITGQLPLLFWDEKKQSEQPQGNFFAQIALQREPCILAVSFIGGENQSTRRKPLTSLYEIKLHRVPERN